MNFHTFGSPENPTILLIHGMLTPWQVLEAQIERFKADYYVIAPALDAHKEERASEFNSVSAEAEQIENYVIDRRNAEVFAAVGLSMGGGIAFKLWQNGVIGIKKLILDGAPLTGFPMLAAKAMTVSYLDVIRKSKKRDPKTLDSFKRDFLPEKYLDSFLKIADNMSESSVRNIVGSLGDLRLSKPLPESGTEMLFLHGTKGNEVISKSVAKRLAKVYENTKIHCFDGYTHCEAAIYKPQEWLSVAEKFLSD